MENKKNMNFLNKNAILTGGAGGIALATCNSLVKQGAKVTLLDVDIDTTNRKIESYGWSSESVRAMFCDVTDTKSVEAAYRNSSSWMGGIDILVTCAGGYKKYQDFENTSEEDWDKIIALNLKSVFLCCKAVIPYMKERGWGRIVNIGSLAGRSAITGTSPVAYGAAKAAVSMLTQYLAKDIAPHNITANTIAPGTTKTERVEKLLTPEKHDRFIAMTPAKRLAEPDDIADVILFLASDNSRYITGATLDVNGGRLMVL
jgi:NAD(P)-dependent dehydrogenase (short-subunit alcohol dehydrogenase family)